MIEVTITCRRTGRTHTFKGTGAVVLTRENDETVAVCVAGTTDEGEACAMLKEAHFQVQAQRGEETPIH